MKTKIFIDFDGTIFDTAKFKKYLYEVFEKTGAKESDIDETYKDECSDYLYSPEENLKRLHCDHDFDIEGAMALMDEQYKHVPELLYSDTIEFLKNIDRAKYEVNMLSLGDIDFQKKKFIHSGLESYFNNVYYCENQKWEFLDTVVDEDEKFIIIDDRSDTIMQISDKYANALAIKISRFDEIMDGYTAIKDFEGIEIKDLTEATKYL